MDARSIDRAHRRRATPRLHRHRLPAAARHLGLTTRFRMSMGRASHGNRLTAPPAHRRNVEVRRPHV
eukprot:2700241-Alexandrium_andersonii.AAC.1